MAREVFNGLTLSPDIVGEIKTFTRNCPNVYFGTPDYPIPPVACGMMGCRVLEEGCKKIPGIQKPSDKIIRAVDRVKSLTKPR